MTHVDLVIKGGRIALLDGSLVEADVAVSGETICGLGTGFDASEIIDATGLVVLPGAVDGHVHMMDPGYTSREDFTTGTTAAAYGGTTTVIEHHRTDPQVFDWKELERKRQHLEGRSLVDFALKGGISHGNLGELRQMWDRGITAFKMFTCYLHGADAIHVGLQQYVFTEIARMNGTVLIHAEDDGIVSANEQALRAAGRKDYMTHYEARSELAETLAIRQALLMAERTGARVVFAHVSTPENLSIIKEARARGVKAYAETCPQYFYLSTETLREKGPWVKFAPPVKPPGTQERMWEAMARGLVDIISSDHCPFEKERKERGLDDMWAAPPGIPGVETCLRLMLTGVAEGKIHMGTLVACMSTNPARLYGLYPRKGSLAVGSDADLVLVDMNASETLANAGVKSKCGWTPYEGTVVRGIPLTTIVRGKVVVRDREIVGKPGFGRFVPRGRTWGSVV
ncbi:MAG: dihydroorotase family protein [Firmicutes bacterium]|jgi:D-hydantoinase|nr:dihydroorotase family protein [Bacillota bacterium]MDH7496484.1 dihydroorotase family protein [Bacillota bacterium]